MNKYLIILFITILPLPLLAQFTNQDKPKMMLNIYPAHLIVTTLKAELVKPYRPNLYTVFGTSLIYDFNASENDAKFNEKKGIGLSYGIIRESERRNNDVTYAGIELQTSYLMYTLQDDIFRWHTVDGMSIGSFDNLKFNHNIMKFALHFYVASRTANTELFSMHIFGGAGYQAAYHFNDINNKKYFSDYITQHGFNGLFVTGGMKLGFEL